jgi:hypothetical protein
MSRDTSQIAGDRRLWLAERCPSCKAAAGARCHERFSARRAPPARLSLHAARGWRQRSCPVCKATPGEPCLTPRGRPAPAPHTARVGPARGELVSLEDVWRALERAGAEIALVRFSGGGGRRGTVESVSIEAGGRELARWLQAGESELAGALAAPVWGRYGSFRGQPSIRATLAWSVAERSVVLAGTRGVERFEQTLHQAASQRFTQRRDASPGAQAQSTRRACEFCGQPIAPSARPESRYCGKRCRQAASRARLREQSGRAGLAAPERCTWCNGPMPTGLRPEARYCGKRCRQAASRARLALARGRDPGHRAASPQTAPSEQLRIQ